MHKCHSICSGFDNTCLHGLKRIAEISFGPDAVLLPISSIDFLISEISTMRSVNENLSFSLKFHSFGIFIVVVISCNHARATVYQVIIPFLHTVCQINVLFSTREWCLFTLFISSPK